jgi:tetratricopeptide (TPR) repeat protein
MLAQGPPPPDAADRAADLVLARLHLRLGSYGLARAELESLAGRNALDDEGIRDLAEARWRTGDLPGAGEAAAAYLDLRPDDPLGLVISAELQSHLGRPAEARRIAARALAQDEEAVEEIFAGMPRSPVWPVEPGAPIEPAGTLFAELSAAAPIVPGTTTDRPADGGTERHAAASPPAPGLWEHHLETAAPVLPNPGELLARARTAMAAERPGQAAASLALALRAEPSLAPAVLDLIAGRTEPVLALVRGDAHRIVGHETEALLDYVAAVAAIGLERAEDRRAEDRRAPDHGAGGAGADGPPADGRRDEDAGDGEPILQPATVETIPLDLPGEIAPRQTDAAQADADPHDEPEPVDRDAPAVEARPIDPKEAP